MICLNCLTEKTLKIVNEGLSDNNILSRERECEDCGQKVFTNELIDYSKTKLKRLQK